MASGANLLLLGGAEFIFLVKTKANLEAGFSVEGRILSQSRQPSVGHHHLAAVGRPP